MFGFATPTEAAGCGAMGALLLSLAYKKLSLSKLQEALVKTLEITALIMVLVAASNFFGAVFARLGTPTLLTEFLLGCLLYTSPSPRDRQKSRMPSSA